MVKAEALLEALRELENQDVIRKVPRAEEGRGFYSHVFIVKKPSGKFRLILNLKPLNASVTYKRFRMESIFSVKALLPHNCFMVSLDLRDAYLHIPIAEASQKFLRLAIDLGGETIHFQFQALPFGLSSAPRIFTKVLAEAMAFLRLQGVCVIAYLDDLLLFAASPAQLVKDLNLTKRVLTDLGWLLNLEKSSLIPSQQISYLGFLLDSTLLRVFLPKEKVQKLDSAVASLQNNQLVSIRVLMSVLGLLTSTLPAVQWAGLHFRPLQTFILGVWDHSQEALDTLVHIPLQVKRSLWWWRKVTNLSQGRLWLIPVSRVVTTDASGKGWGAHLGSLLAQGTWEDDELTRSSNWKELRAVGLALRFFKKELQGHHIQVRSDNSSVVAYLNKQGGTRSGTLLSLATEILSWAETYTLSLSAVFLRGEKNVVADFLSRKKLREGDWVLNQEVFNLIVKRWGVSGGGPVRVQRQCKNPLFFLPKKGRGSSRGGCLEPGLAFRNLLCLPTSSVASSSEEVSDGKHISDSGGSTLAKESMVLSTKTVGDRTSPALAPSGRSPLSGASPMPTGTPVEVSGLATEEGLLKSKGFSEKLVSTLLVSRKKETRQIYERVWLRFNKWCAESSFSVRSSSAVLEFLQRGADKGLSISTLRGQVSALIVFLEDHLATNPWVVRFFRALSRQRPVQGLSFPRWDLSLVLQSLTGPPFEPLKECFLRELTLKTVFLVAVTTARRVSEMEALSVRAPFCVIFPDRIVLKTDPAFLPKVASSFHRSQEIVLPSFCPNPSGEKELRFHYLDVRRCILHYLELTKAFRRSDSLFVLFSGARKGCKASRRTIARWLRVAIEQAYSAAGKEIPVGIKAHSTRAMAASQAERAGATPEQICKAATWSSYSTFVKHYRVDLVSAGEQTFGRKVLQAVVPP
ncbi:uncharacterized protein LOC143984042 [Lithobates pipiens]